MPRDPDGGGWVLLEDEMGRHHGWTAEETEAWLSDYQWVRGVLELDLNRTVRERREARRRAEFEAADER